MAISEELGERRMAGLLDYRERGDGPAMVFAHGAGVNGDLWRKVAPQLADRYRCIVPDLPLGAHSLPLPESVDDCSLFGQANLLADFIEALDLHDVTLVGNDTGGAISQAVVTSRPERIGRLVLTSCDAFDNYPPQGRRLAQAHLPSAARALAARACGAAEAGPAASRHLRLGHQRGDRAAHH